MKRSVDFPDAMRETFGEVAESLIACARYLLDENDATSEAFVAFLSAYDKYDPKRNPDFADFAYQHTYYRVLDVRKKRLKDGQRERTGVKIPEVADTRPADPTEGARRVRRFLNDLPDDAKVVAEFALSSPKKTEQAIRVLTRDHDNPKETRRLYRRAVVFHLTKKKWTPWRIESAFRLLERAVSGFGRSQYSLVGA